MRSAFLLVFILFFSFLQGQTVLSPPDTTIVPTDTVVETVKYELQSQTLSKSGLLFSKISLQTPDSLIALRERRGTYETMAADDQHRSQLPEEVKQAIVYAEKEGFLSVFYLLENEKEVLVKELLRHSKEGKMTTSLIHQLKLED